MGWERWISKPKSRILLPFRASPFHVLFVRSVVKTQMYFFLSTEKFLLNMLR